MSATTLGRYVWTDRPETSTVRVPRWMGLPQCREIALAPIPSYACTRPALHSGRHLATVPGGVVVAIWETRS